MRARMLTTTAMAYGMLVPIAALAQPANDPAPVIQGEVATPADTRRSSDIGEPIDGQDFRGALAKLEDAQKRFEQVAYGNTRFDALTQARADSRDAVDRIERTLQQYPDPADDPRVTSARRSINETRAMLQHDRRPQQLARVLGTLHSAVIGLQQMSDR